MSFRLAGYKWGDTTLGTSSGQINWSADLSSGLNFNTSQHDLADFENTLRSAFDTWESYASVEFNEVADPTDAEFLIGTASYPGSVVGRAQVATQEGGQIDEIVAAVVTFDSDELWSPDGETEGVDFEAVALHEIGHAIGLLHVNDTSEIMNPVLSTDELGDGDVRGVQELYGTDPGDLPPPPDTGDGGPDTDEPDDDTDAEKDSLFDQLFGWLIEFFEMLTGNSDDDDDSALTNNLLDDHDDHDHDHDHDDHDHDDHDHDHEHAPLDLSELIPMLELNEDDLMAAIAELDAEDDADADMTVL